VPLSAKAWIYVKLGARLGIGRGLGWTAAQAARLR